jgi:hypothetical protein
LYNQNFTNVGLNTLSFSLPTAGPYFVDGKLSLPTNTDDGAAGTSSCVVTVNQNGSPIYVGLPGAEGFHCTLLAAANDAITVVFSSANAIDQAPNAVKATIGCSSGQ